MKPLLMLAVLALSLFPAWAAMPGLTVSENKRFLVTADGKAIVIGEFASDGDGEFTRPDEGGMIDWVLVLDEAAKNYTAPGMRP